jgi:hypothetical protein
MVRGDTNLGEGWLCLLKLFTQLIRQVMSDIKVWNIIFIKKGKTPCFMVFFTVITIIFKLINSNIIL